MHSQRKPAVLIAGTFLLVKHEKSGITSFFKKKGKKKISWYRMFVTKDINIFPYFNKFLIYIIYSNVLKNAVYKQ